MWSQLVMTILGIWMMVAPQMLNYNKNISDNSHIIGPMIATFSMISIWECTRNARLLNLPLALWMMAAPIFISYNNDAALMHDYGVAILIVFLLLVKPARNHTFGGGWPSIWRSNSPHSRIAGNTQRHIR